MNKYRVQGGIAKFGPGAEMKLTAAQIALRAHNLELPKDYDGKSDAVVKTLTGIEFKNGEVIGLADIPRNLANVIVSVDAPKQESADPKQPPNKAKAKAAV